MTNKLKEALELLMNNEREMPKYVCHKKVCALKIKDIKYSGLNFNEVGIITPEENGYAPFEVDNDYIRKHHPKIGGYYVVYEDGYKSFSPAKAFENGYSLITKSPHGGGSNNG